jgi:ribosome biogenesis GTPase / thiamine phosphate phosphatase
LNQGKKLEINQEALRRIGLSNAMLQQAVVFNESGTLLRVVEVHRETVALHDGTTQFSARMQPSLQRALAGQEDAVAVGDWIVAQRDVHGQWWIHARLAPASHLVRRDGSGQRHVVVSNVDTVFIVMGLDHDFNPRRLERYLALVHASGSGVLPVVALTKTDQCADVNAALDTLRNRIPGDVPLHAVNALHESAARNLAPYLTQGQTVVLIGSSGAGKSTLTNTLLGIQVQDTGAVRLGDSRGRHTTTARSLHLLAGGACIIDTPGMRTLQPDADVQTLTASFADIESLAAHCRFRDCTHHDEPGCAVRAGVDADRLKNFHKLLRDARRDTLTALEKQAQLSRWKVMARGGRERAKMKKQPQ